ncbi:MAG: tetratricopeptide repeat protein [Chitinophagales bacterium]
MRNLIPKFIEQSYIQAKFEGKLEAFTLFLDVSGFTSTTQQLMQRGDDGAEVLSALLNTIFDPMINTVHEYGGIITFFAGDAFMCVFPRLSDDDKTLPNNSNYILECARKLQGFFKRKSIYDTIFGSFELQIKIGIAYGNVEWGIVGGKNKKAFFFKGITIDLCTKAESHAQKGDIILHKSVANYIPHKADILEQFNPNYFKYTAHFSPPFPKTVQNTTTEIATPNHFKFEFNRNLTQEVVQKFLPSVVVELKEQGEFRNIASVFIAFEGVETYEKINLFALIVLNLTTQFGAYFNSIEYGDKGGVMICFFGAPLAHENDLERALSFALIVKREAARRDELQGLKIKIGITTGKAYAGFIGGAERCEYTAIGNIVNLSVRLMMAAEWGAIRITEQIAQTSGFEYRYKGDLKYKGFQDPIPSYELINRIPITTSRVFKTEMIGRRAELAQLKTMVAPIFSGHFGGLTYIFGEAGIGKSRMAYELRNYLVKRIDINWFKCPADQILKQSLNPIKGFLSRYFKQQINQPRMQNRQTFELKFKQLVDRLNILLEEQPENETIKNIKEELTRTKSVLAAQLDLIYDNSLWTQLDAKGRYNNALIALKSFFLAESLLQPTIIELEDAHWLDADTVNFLSLFTRNIEEFPVFILCTSRYNDDGSQPFLPIDNNTNLKRHFIDLDFLTQFDLRLFAEKQMNGRISDDLFQLLSEKTKGNPFFAEQILNYFDENQLLEKRQDVWHLNVMDVVIPDTIKSILVARIDRLSNRVKEVVKVAAVIGREFEVNLISEILHRSVSNELKIAEDEQIWQIIHEIQGIFRHALLRDTAYNMQLQSRLLELHRLTAESMESIYALQLDKYYDAIAFHYEKAKIFTKTLFYLEKAGDFAKQNYQNEQALNFYNRLLLNLTNVTESDAQSHSWEQYWEGKSLQDIEIKTLLKKAAILEVIGRWGACEDVCEEAVLLAEKTGSQVFLAQTNQLLGSLALHRSAYNKAMTHYGRAMALFSVKRHQEGIAEALGNMGKIYHSKGDLLVAMQFFKKQRGIAEQMNDRRSKAHSLNNIGEVYCKQGNFEEGMNYYEKALSIAESLDDQRQIAKILGNVGTLYRDQKRYDLADGYYDRQLEHYMQLGDKQGIAISIGHKGDICRNKKAYDEAMVFYQKQLILATELGDKKSIFSAVGNTGNIYKRRGNYDKAMDCYKQNLLIANELKDKQRIAFAIGNMGVIYKLKGEFDAATECYQKQLRIAEELSDENREALVLGNIGNLYFSKGQFQKAMEIYERQLRLAERIGDEKRISFALGNMGNIYTKLGVYEKAMAFYERKLKIAEKNKDSWRIALVVGNMGVVNKYLENYTAALSCYDRAIDIGRAIGDKYGLSHDLINKADILYMTSHFDFATTLTEEGIAIAKGISNQEQVFEGSLLLAKIDAKKGKTVVAVDALQYLLKTFTSPVQQATSYYELWQMTKNDTYRKAAQHLYQHLYQQAKFADYRKRLQELGD